jgi:hypothetical protein
MKYSDDKSLSLKLAEKTKEANELRAKLRKNDSHLRKIIRQLEQMLDEAGIPWREKLQMEE